MRDWIGDAFEWVVAAFFIFVIVLLPFGLVGGVLYLVRAVWGLEP